MDRRIPHFGVSRKDIDDANFLPPWVRVRERVEEAFSSSPNMNLPKEKQEVFC